MEVSTPVPCCPLGIYRNGQTCSRVDPGLALQDARLSPIHLPLFTLCLPAACPLFTRLGSDHRQYRVHIAYRDHLYGFGCESHVRAQLLTYLVEIGTANLILSDKSWGTTADRENVS